MNPALVFLIAAGVAIAILAYRTWLDWRAYDLAEREQSRRIDAALDRAEALTEQAQRLLCWSAIRTALERGPMCVVMDAARTLGVIDWSTEDQGRAELIDGIGLRLCRQPTEQLEAWAERLMEEVE